MPAPVAAKAAVAVLRTRRGRRLLLALLGGALLAFSMLIVVLLSAVGAVAGRCETEASSVSESPAFVSQEPSEEALSDIPADYLTLYREAGEEYGLDWAVLAAVGKIETDHGRLDAPGVTSGENSSGAGGPMQFLASTWASVGVDGNSDDVKDRYDPEDAIPGAANYLKLEGAPQDYRAALFAYNNAGWYVDDVLAQAEVYRAAAGEGEGEMAASQPSSVLATVLSPLAARSAHAAQGVTESTGGVEGNTRAVFPLEERYADGYEDTWGASRGAGRTHEGTDLFAEEGAPIYSIVSGEVVPVSGADEQGWNTLGGWTVMVEVSESVGPIQAGDTLYYAHMREPAAVLPGDTVEAGDLIGSVGSTGEGPPGTLLQPASRGRHLHLGWYDPTMQRAEMPSGAMNPYPMLEWLRESGGVASGGEAAPAALGSSVALLPEYCDPFLDAGLISGVAGTVGDMVDGGDAGAAPTSGSGGTGEQVVQEAEKYLGTPYVLGGPEDCVPGEAMDCTCLTTTVFEEFGQELPDDPEALMEYGEPVEGEPQAGDVLVWGDPGDGTGGHAAIALGDGRIIHANMATMDTSITPMYESPLYLGARRLVDE